MTAHWPKHKLYHKVQKQVAERVREETGPEGNRLAAEQMQRRAERTGDEYDQRFADGLALMTDGDLHAADKAWRKIIKEWPHRPTAYHNLASVMGRSGRYTEAALLYLKTMELCEEGTKRWAEAAAAAFDLLKTPDCHEVPTPEWWNDEGLKAVSVWAVAVAPDEDMPCVMWARVLSGDALSKAPWNAGPRTAAEIKEAATWYRRAAMLTSAPSRKKRYDNLATQCDEFADPLLVEQEAEAAAARAAAEAEAAKARAAAEAEEAKAMKVAEAKAAAAAEELLAEEVKEKQQAANKTAGKAKEGKGKKGKGRR